MSGHDAGLGAFLDARYGEAEAMARDLIESEAAAAEWHEQSSGVLVTGPPEHDDAWAGMFAIGDSRITRFIAATDPAHRLADIALKRAILALHRSTVTKREQHAFDSSTGEPIPDEYDGDCELCGWFDPEAGGCKTVRQLGTEFSGHPGYKQEWAP